MPETKKTFVTQTSLKPYEIKNEYAVNDLVRLAKKDRVVDIFKNLPILKTPMQQESMKEQRFLEYKYKSRVIQTTTSRINMLIGLKLPNALLYIQLLLKRIDLSKKKLILDIDNKSWTSIPSDLSQMSLPASFRFYDFLINHIQEQFPQERKDYFELRQLLSNQFHQKKENEQWFRKFLSKKQHIEQVHKLDTRNENS